SGTLTTLYSFCIQTGCPDGSYPYAGLIQPTDGNFYGTTSSGGASNFGTVFKITPAGALTTLYSFCSQPKCTDGYTPEGSLVQGSDGNFYGTTDSGGAAMGTSTGQPRSAGPTARRITVLAAARSSRSPQPAR